MGEGEREEDEGEERGSSFSETKITALVFLVFPLPPF